MTDQLSVLRDARTKAYLTEVHMAVAAVDPAAADGIMREIADHLREAAAEPGFELDRALTDLGDPALIAAGIEPAAPARAPGSFVDSSAGVIVTVLALTLGTWWTFAVGWIVGIALLWSSHRWSRADKIIGSIAWPFAVLAGLAGSAFGGLGFWNASLTAAIVVPLLAGVWLLVRGLDARPAVVRPRMPVVAHAGRGSWLETPLAAGIVIGSAALGVAAFVAVALIDGHPSGLLPLLAVAGLGGAATLSVLWISRSWEALDKVVGTGLLAVAAITGAFAWVTAVTAGTSGTMCVGTACTPVVTVRGEDLADIAAQVIVPLVLAYIVLLGVRFQAAGSSVPARPGRGVGIVLVAAVTIGGVGFVLLTLSRVSASAPLLSAAVVALALWGAGVIGVWRSPGWTGIDRAAATLTLPLLAVIPLLMPRRYADPANGDGGGINPLLPGELSAPDGVLLWAVFGTVSAVLAAWLLVRFFPEEAGVGARAARVPTQTARAVSPRVIAGVGLVAVCAYAIIAALQILVWNPLAAVPGASLAEISAHLAQTGEQFALPQVWGILAVGPMLALAPLILSWRSAATAISTLAMVCAILAGGAFGYFAASFGPGMSLADAYGISGADAAPWGGVLMAVSAIAFVGAVVCGIPLLRGRARQ